PAPEETLPGVEATSTPMRPRSWQLAQEMLSGCPLGARATLAGRPTSSTCVARPEKRASWKNHLPSWLASGLPQTPVDGSGGTGPGFVSAERRDHSTLENPQPAPSQKRSSAPGPQPEIVRTSASDPTTPSDLAMYGRQHILGPRPASPG